MHAIFVPNNMWSCAISTVVHLRNRIFNRALGPSGGVLLTFLTGIVPDASTFRVFGCAVFAKVPDNLRRKLSLKAFRGVMVGHSHISPGYRVYNPATRRITTSVHVKFQESVPGFGTSHPLDSSIDVFFDADDALDAPGVTTHTQLSHDGLDPIKALPDSGRPTRVTVPHARFGDYVAHVSTVPHVCVTDSCEPDLSDHADDIMPLLDFSLMVAHPRHMSTEGPAADVALVSASVCVESASYKAALVSLQSAEWQHAMQLEFDSPTSNETWDLVPLHAWRRVVNNMWVYKAKTDANGALSRYKARFVAKGCGQREGIDYT
jgi:hypothetical protein